MSENNERLDEFVSKLIILTKDDKIRWEYLDSNKELYDHINLYPYVNSMDSLSNAMLNKIGFDSSNSYYTSINNNHIVIFTRISSSKEESIYEKLQLWLVPRTYKAINKLDIKNNIVSLQSIIKSKFPNSDDIINDIITYSNNDIF